MVWKRSAYNELVGALHGAVGRRHPTGRRPVVKVLSRSLNVKTPEMYDQHKQHSRWTSPACGSRPNLGTHTTRTRTIRDARHAHKTRTRTG